ncbi:MAG: hypothetical protein ATN36_05870 [Epulopiscium sp. Nele67-Bin005]|nr:MAG: hypothetical protein ATN36_05870 [Epulopiscium sp. Nele67-Bin005]
MKKHKIIDIIPDSIAQELEIEAGDLLVSINKENIEDVFDYRFLLADEEIEIVIQKPTGNQWVIEIEKDFDEDLGLIFETELMDELFQCRNKCKFCFIDQLPPNMRETVYFKDDDWRMSFLNGNYITLTNMSDEDMKRIIKHKLSPLNISVHATHPDVRKELLKNKNAGKILEQIKILIDAGIKLNGQIVLCRGINDEDILDQTITDLSKFIPNILSLTIVPVGISKFRDKLEPLIPFDKESARDVIAIVEKWQSHYLDNMGTHFVYAADEFFVVGEREPLTFDQYEGFQVLDNGVGMMTKFRHELLNGLKKSEASDKKVDCICVTGRLTEKFMKDNIKLTNDVFPNFNIEVWPVDNKFFGEKITVTGLLVGQDIINSFKNRNISGKVLLIAENMLKCGEDVFLDDYTISNLEEQLKCKVQVMPNEGMAWIDIIKNL